MMNRFLADTEVLRMPLPTEFKEDFQDLISFQRGPVGTLGSDSNNYSEELQIPHHSTRCVFNASDLSDLTQLFTGMYTAATQLEVHSTYSRYLTIGVRGEFYGSYTSRSKNCSIVFAKLNGVTRPARINYFAKVSTSIDETLLTKIVASVSWFRSHPQENHCGKPVTIWEYDLFDVCNFILVQDIVCRTVTLVDKLNDIYGNVLFVAPYNN